jgi:hypothetical protein
MRTTTQKLAMTEFDYEMMIFGFYGRWCEDVTTNMRDYQAVLANSSINAWFLMELRKCEAEFHQLTNIYDPKNLTPLDYMKCYNNCTFHLFNIRPKALLEAVKTKVPKGIKVLTNQFNQN